MKNKYINIDKQEDKIIISVYPKIYKDEQANNVSATVITLAKDIIKVSMDIDINVSNDEYDEVLGINKKTEDNVYVKGTWISKKEFVTNLGSMVNKIEIDEDESELEHAIQIITHGNTINIRTKNEEVQSAVFSLLEEWFYE